MLLNPRIHASLELKNWKVQYKGTRTKKKKIQKTGRELWGVFMSGMADFRVGLAWAGAGWCNQVEVHLYSQSGWAKLGRAGFLWLVLVFYNLFGQVQAKIRNLDVQAGFELSSTQGKLDSFIKRAQILGTSPAPCRPGLDWPTPWTLLQMTWDPILWTLGLGWYCQGCDVSSLTYDLRELL